MAQPTGSDNQRAPDQNELLRQAEQLKNDAASAQDALRRKQKRSAFGQAQRHVTDTHQALASAGRFIKSLVRNVITPLASLWLVRAPLRGYRNLWRRIVYVPDADGDLLFSKRRAGVMVLLTAVGLWMAPAVLGACVELVWDTSRMAMSYKSGEIWYLGKSQEIDPAGNVFSAQGCASVSCTDQTSIYFRIKPSIAHHAWSLYTNGNVFFPDFVAAGIQNDVNKCHVTGYGSRWKFFVRNWDIYPQILAVECVPITEEEITAVQESLEPPP
ncbi:MAG: hypothetical protein ACR2RB_00585 [Gammaproteobacteria bacterium]